MSASELQLEDDDLGSDFTVRYEISRFEDRRAEQLRLH